MQVDVNDTLSSSMTLSILCPGKMGGGKEGGGGAKMGNKATPTLQAGVNAEADGIWAQERPHRVPFEDAARFRWVLMLSSRFVGARQPDVALLVSRLSRQYRRLTGWS